MTQIAASSIKEILLRIDTIIRQNKRTEILFIILTTILFLSGIACFVMALITKEYAWSSPSVVTTSLLYWPLNKIKEMRQKNIAIAVAPMLITTLPKKIAATEIQNLLKSLYGDK
jgi:hypothetical protein